MADSEPKQASGFDPFEQHLVAGGELLRQDRVDDAKGEFLAALDIRPKDEKALGLLGLACFRMASFQEALPIYQLLVELRPDDASYRLNLGLTHLKLGDPTNAIVELEHSRELDPSQTRTVSYLGLAYARNGSYADAYQSFLRAGQDDLASEMARYLSDEQRQALEAALIPAARSDAGAAEPIAEEQVVEEQVEPLDVTDAAVELIADEPESGVVAVAEPQPAPAREAEEGVSAVPEESSEEPSDGAPVAPMEDVPSRGVITQAVDSAGPAQGASHAGTRVAPGAQPPQTLTELATTRLIRPEGGDHTFEISSAGWLVIRVDGQLFARTEGVDVSGGELAYEPAARHVRGRASEEAFASGGRQMFIISGKGHLLASPLGEIFTAVTLDDDIFYLREDFVFAFEQSLQWENGHVPGSDSKIVMVQFRGQGSVAFRSARPLVAIKLAPDGVLYVDARVLAGWIGRVVPRAVAPVGGGKKSTLFVECTGEGVVLVEEEEAAGTAGARSGAPPGVAG